MACSHCNQIRCLGKCWQTTRDSIACARPWWNKSLHFSIRRFLLRTVCSLRCSTMWSNMWRKTCPAVLWSDSYLSCDSRTGTLCLCNPWSIRRNDWPNRIHGNCMRNTQNRWLSIPVRRCRRMFAIGRSAPNHVYCPNHRFVDHSRNVFYIFEVVTTGAREI